MPNRYNKYGGMTRAYHYYDYYRKRYSQIQEHKTMTELTQSVTDAKLELMNKLNTLQRDVIDITPDATNEREIKNLNREINAVNTSFATLIGILEDSK